MTVAQQIEGFRSRSGKEISVNNRTWRYYRLGSGSPVLWLTGGMRRAAPGFAFLERLAQQHTVIAPDYQPVKRVAEFMTAFDAILQTEGVNEFALVGQSYGGMLSQAYLAHRGKAVERLIIVSAGPANYSRGWIPVEFALIALVRLLPDKTIRRMLTRTLLPLVTLPDANRAEWAEAVKSIIQNELSRADLVSHLAVVADLMRKRVVNPAAYRNWHGRIAILHADNDPTRSKQDIANFEQLFGRPVRVFSMGDMGHTALLSNPDKFVALLHQALAWGDDPHFTSVHA